MTTMQSAETVLLFTRKPNFETVLSEPVWIEHCKALMLTEQIEDAQTRTVSYCGGGMIVTIARRDAPLGAAHFAGALDSALSRTCRPALSQALSQHNYHLALRVSYTTDTGDNDWLLLLQMAHALTVLLSGLTDPAAVYWRQSNQLLTGAQYKALCEVATPWALFAHARVQVLEPAEAGGADDRPSRGASGGALLHRLTMPNVASLIGRPIEFEPTSLPINTAHSAALSFLRYVVESGEDFADGDSFGPEGGPWFTVRTTEPTAAMPNGSYLIAQAADTPEAPAGAQARATVVDAAQADMPCCCDGDAPATGPAADASAPVDGADTGAAPGQELADTERKRSLALGFLMLVIMPPVGAFLMLSNALFGSSTWRTGIVAAAALTLAMLLGAYTFFNAQGGDRVAAQIAGSGGSSSSLIAN